MPAAARGPSHRRTASSSTTSTASPLLKGTPPRSSLPRKGYPQTAPSHRYRPPSTPSTPQVQQRRKVSNSHTKHVSVPVPSRIRYDDSSRSDASSSISRERRDVQASPKKTADRMKTKSFRDESPSRRYTRQREPSPLKQTKYPTAKKAVEALHKAIGHEQRIAATANACTEFDHWDEDKHAAELNYGAANVLGLVLSMTDDDDEIRMVCAALEMVFRASHKMVQAAFLEVGAALVPLLLRLLERCESGSMVHADISIMNISKTLFYMSRVPELRVPLARQQGMLDALVRVATSILNADCRIARSRILANLANSDDNKIMMFEHDGLLDSLLRIAALDMSEKAREFAGDAIMDLASCPANQIQMAKIDKLLGTLVKMAVMENVASTRECAISSLQNLAFAKENRIRLVTYSSGVVLEALKKTVSGDPNDKARRRGAGALTNLACEETAERMGSHKGLLETLAVVSTKDDNDDVQTRASLALTKIATHITCKMNCHETLLDSLVVASLSANANSVSAVLRVKARDPENRESMARHPGILDTLADICVSSEYSIKDRDNAMRALMHLTNESKNVKVMCNKTILDALVTGASLEGSAMVGIRDSAIIAMERLATEFSNRQYMARHDGLIVVVAKATEREAKLEHSGMAKGQSLLAKPLLMSLLVAL